MPTYDVFIRSLKSDLKTKKLTYDDAAEVINLSRRQFARYIKGETKQVMMPVDMLEELRKKEIASIDTVQHYLQNIRVRLRCKKVLLRKKGLRKRKAAQEGSWI